ncbi:hypothetical protein Ccrd_023630 [Cynara cardunculus var. scolymus]|uniref:Uncharacterized protein n=1 Tax=Cynara cardunculus var. scolymus TaxID=59895 RepID=A0A103XWI1_CYNCS|nr:hypothetical protein Ccrd_023630 [Cynara cardunculus var. scolymus]
MVSKVEQAKESQQQKSQNHHHNDHHHHHHRRQLVIQKETIMQCNKGNTTKFKRSTSHLEDDGVSSAILLLACIACGP